MQNPLEYNTQRELYGIRVSRLNLDPAGLESSFLPADDVNFAVFAVEFWRIARNLLHLHGSFVDSRSCLGCSWLLQIVRISLYSLKTCAKCAESAWFAVNSFCWLVQGRLLFLCGLHEICVTRGYRWRMARNLLSLRAIPFICLQKTD